MTRNEYIEEHKTNVELRNYFAANCPDKEIGSPTWHEIKKFKGFSMDLSIEAWKEGYTLEWRCAQRFKYADAMLKASKQTGGNK